VTHEGADKLPQPQRPRPVDTTGLLSVVVQELHHAILVIHIIGEVDMATGPALQDHVDRVLATRPQRLIIDLSQVSFMGSTALSVLLNARHVAAQQDTTVQLRGTDRRAVAVPLRITGVDRLFDV